MCLCDKTSFRFVSGYSVGTKNVTGTTVTGRYHSIPLRLMCQFSNSMHVVYSDEKILAINCVCCYQNICSGTAIDREKKQSLTQPVEIPIVT